MNGQDIFSPNYQDRERGNYSVFQPANEKAILNWFKRDDIDKSQKNDIIKALINFQDECGGFYQYRSYFLASKFINTFKDSDFGDEIVAKLLNWSYDYFSKNENNTDVENELKKEAQQALEDTDKAKVIESFVKLIETAEDESILLAATQKLIELDSSNQLAISTLGEILRNTEDKNIIFELIIQICKNSKLSESLSIELTDILLKYLEDIESGDDSEEVWILNTFYYLKKIAVDDQKAIQGLIALIQKLSIHHPAKDEYICEEALKTLEEIGKNNHTVVIALTDFIHSNPIDSLLYLAARILWFVDQGNLLTVNTCIRLLETSKNSYVIRDVSLFLLKDELKEFTSTIDFYAKAMYIIFDYIKNAQRIDICFCIKSISVLEKISVNNKAVLQGLIGLLDSAEDKSVCIAVANSILSTDVKNEKALSIIYQALNTTKEDWKRYNIAKNLLDIDPNNKIAWNTFEKLLTTSKEKYSCLEIAKKLVKLNSSHQKAIDTLCKFIYMPRQYDSIAEENSALPVLEQIDPTKKLAIKAIEEFCQTTKDQDGLIYMIKNLQRLDPGNDIAQKRLDRIIAAVIDSMQTYDPEDDYSLLNVGIYWRGIMKSSLLPEIVTALKPYLDKKTSGNCDNYDVAFMILWDCANKMSYLDFYKAWHAL